MATGLLASGAYIPKRRLKRSAIFKANAWFAPGLAGLAKGERAVSNWDEDALTMAVEAARDCLTGLDRTTVASLSLSSTTLPFVDRSNAGVVKEALVLNETISTLDLTGSQRAGTSALIDALNGSATRLCLAAERRTSRPASEGELQQADAAAALLVGDGEVIATFIGSYSVALDFVDHFRATGEAFDYVWESRWIRDEGYAKILGGALKDGLNSLGVRAAAIDHAILPIPVRGVPASLAKTCGIRAEAVRDTLIDAVGDSGSAHPLLMLAATLEIAKPGETILVAGFGQGADVIVLKTTERLAETSRRWGVAGHLANRQEDDNYMRFLFHRGLLDVERGMRAESDEKQPGTTLYRNRKTVFGLVGGRCTKTGTIQFPRSEISVNPNDRAQGTQEDYPLADKRARIVTFTADALTYSPDPPCFYGMLDFEGGGRMMAEFADVTSAEVDVGREMRMVFRIKAVDEKRHFIRYFWKAVPAAKGEQ